MSLFLDNVTIVVNNMILFADSAILFDNNAVLLLFVFLLRCGIAEGEILFFVI